MAKNHHTQYHSKQQTQTSSIPPAYAYTLDESASSGTPMQSLQADDMEEDDLCPVCESECTCVNRPRSINNALPLPSRPSLDGSAMSLATQKALEGDVQSSSAAEPPSLKIKLTIRPTSLSHNLWSEESMVNGGKAITPRQHKRKSKSNAEATSAGANGANTKTPISSPFSAPGQPLASGGGPSARLNADGSVPKKRGRPSKAAIAAREAAAKGEPVVKCAKVATADTDQTISNVEVARLTPHMNVRRPVTTKSGTRKAGKRKTSTQRKPANQSSNAVENDSSELSELDDENETMDDAQSIQFPTFVSAFSLSSNSSSASSESENSDSDDSKDGESSDSRDTISSKARKDTMDEDEHWQHRKRGHRNNWEIRSRKQSVGVDESSDAGIEADSDEMEEEEDEDEDDGEAQEEDEDVEGPGARRLMRYAGVATGWTDDEDEDTFDADLFFANLSDSSADNSDDEQVTNEQENFNEEDDVEEETPVMEMEFGLGLNNFDTMMLSEAAAAGFFAPFSDLERSGMGMDSSWDMHSLLSNVFRQENAADSASTFQAINDALGPHNTHDNTRFEETDVTMATSEDEEIVVEFDNEDSQDPDDCVEIFEDSDGGETTEDEYVDIDGVAMPRNMVLLRFPASLGAIDPMSTLSSPVRSPVQRGRSLPSNRTSALKPMDILAGKFSLAGSDENEGIYINEIPAVAPPMGSFVSPVTDTAKHVIIRTSGSNALEELPPSPFPAIRRLRRRSASLSMSRSGSISGSSGSRPSSLMAKNRSPYQSLIAGDFDSGENDLPPAEPIRLSDVLEETFLEAESSKTQTPDPSTSETGGSGDETQRHLQNLRRWDRIPMDTFRKTRTAGPVGAFALANRLSAPFNRRAPKPADGISYGSATSGMLRGSPLSATLWDSDTAATSTQANNESRGVRKLGMSVIISPVLLPMRDGDSTPTNDRHRQMTLGYTDSMVQHTAQTLANNIKSRKELRKEKKRSRNFFGSPATSLRRNHFPNAKNRSTSSMQRSNFFSSSMPPLSL